MTGSGHAFSVDPDDLKKMVENIRITEQVLGDSDVIVYPVEEAARQSARRSLVAEVPIKSGDIITSEMLGIKRPGGGLSAHMLDAVTGKRAKRDIEPDQQITLEMLETA